MRRFIRNIVIFGVLFSVGLLLCEWYVRSRRDAIFDRAEYIRENGARIKTIFLGSSISFWGISPSAADSSQYNMAFNSQTLELSYNILKSQLPYLPNLRNVYLEAAYFTFFDPPIEQDYWWYLWIKSNLYYGTVHRPMNPKYNFELAYPAEFRRKMLPWSEPPEIRQNVFGHAVYRPLAQRDSDWQRTVEIIEPSYTAPDWRWKDYNTEYFEKIIRLCREHDIRLTVLIFPAHRVLREALNPEQLAEMYGIVGGMRERYGFEVIDFFEDARFTDDDFFDVSHLNNDAGAAKMTLLVTGRSADRSEGRR